jgi:hypothetical protein
MTTITLTTEEYNAIRQLKQFAEWYIDEREGGFGSKESIEQWEADRDEVVRGVAVLDKIDNQIRETE